MNDTAYLCGLCDKWHVPGDCPEGAPAPPPIDNCPWCERDGRGKNALRQFFNTDTQRPQWACAFCKYGHTRARRKAPAKRRKRVKR